MHATSPTAVAAPPTVSAPRPRWIDNWRPEDPVFWAATGERIARRNLAFSILSEHIGFCVWSMWSVFVLFLGPEYGLDPAQKFLLTTVPTAVGAALRIPYTLAVARFGGRNWTVASALLLLIPSMAAGIALEPGVSFGTLLFVAALAGVGGGNFSSSMANIDAFFPQRLKGWALGLNAGGGNIGVAAVQLVGLAVLATAGAGSPRLILVVYIPLTTGPASRSVVARVVTLTSSRATVLSTGPWTTSAPRRASISACSAARRSPVMPIEKPDSGATRRGWPCCSDVSARSQAARLLAAGGPRRVSVGPHRGRWPRASSPHRCCREVPAPA